MFHFSYGPLVRSSKKRKVVSLLATKVEYHGAFNASTKAIWIRRLSSELRFPIEALIIIHCDNQGAIQVTDNLVAHSNMNHIDIHFH